MKVFAAIPVKELSKAKTRLSKSLPSNLREELVLASLRRVLEALTSSTSIASVMVVSSDPRVLKDAGGYGALCIVEGGALEINEALRLAVDRSLELKADALLIVPCDVPLIEPSDVEEIIKLCSPPPSIVPSPSRDRRGTNALLLNPPHVMPTHFGPHSFQRHLNEALSRGIAVRIYESLNLALDVDDVDDLRALKGRWMKLNEEAFRHIV